MPHLFTTIRSSFGMLTPQHGLPLVQGRNAKAAPAATHNGEPLCLLRICRFVTAGWTRMTYLQRLGLAKPLRDIPSSPNCAVFAAPADGYTRHRVRFAGAN